MKQPELLVLIEKYLEGKASEKETLLLLQYYESFQKKTEWNEAELGACSDMETAILKRLTGAIKEQEKTPAAPLFRLFRFRFAAAAILVVGLFATWWLFNTAEDRSVGTAGLAKKMQRLQHDKPTLILTDGTVMLLDSIADGILVAQQHTQIRKQGEKVVVEVQDNSGAVMALPEGLHTLAVPKGRQYEMVLPDGSQVWLNAASSLRFPTGFNGSERRVEVSGEAYFEVAKDTAKPFRVYAFTQAATDSKATFIEVVGTHFNVTAYDDEDFMKTTLLEGSVKIAAVENAASAEIKPSVLTPGDQALVAVSGGRAVNVKKVDVEEVVAWKSNVFNFNNADLQTIMRQIARWYDVDVVYKGRIPVRFFSGKIKRSLPLSAVLEILEQSNIRFKLVGEQIVVRS